MRARSRGVYANTYLGAATIEFAFCRFIFFLRPPALSGGNVCVRVYVRVNVRMSE